MTTYEDRTDAGLIHRDGVPAWTQDNDRSPYLNLLALVEEVPNCSDRAYEEFAYRYITGLGPESARKALEAIRENDEWPSIEDEEGEEGEGGDE